jgi:hypothetical protein
MTKIETAKAVDIPINSTTASMLIIMKFIEVLVAQIKAI